MKLLQSAVLLLVVAGVAAAQMRAPGPMPADVAPDFTLNTKDGKQHITLSTLTGKPTVLVFASYT